MHASRPSSPPSLSTPTLSKNTPPPLVLPALPSSCDASPSTVLRQLLLEWYSGVAELLIGEAAAADVLCYRNTPHLRACELESLFLDAKNANTRKVILVGGRDDVAGSASTFPAPVSERGALLHSLHFLVDALHRTTCSGRCGSLTDELIAQLTECLSSSRTDIPLSLSSTSAGGAVSPPHQQQLQTPPQPYWQHTLGMHLLDEREEFSSNTNGPPSSLTSMPTVAPHMSPSASVTTTSSLTTASAPTPWWYTLADAVNSMLDSIDRIIDTVFATHPGTALAVTCLTSSSSALSLADSSSCREKQALVDHDYKQEESCIMAGLLLNRNVHVRPGPAFATFTSPLLVVLDLDLTVLRHPLSSVSFRAVQAMSPRELRALYVDASFFCGFCEAVTRRGHELAICSLTEGASDQHWCGLSVPEVVLFLLSAVLPQARTYLTSPDDVVCLPKSVAGPGKLFHLQVLQQRHNARERSPPAAPVEESSSASLSHSSHDVLDGILCKSAPPAPLLLPRWLSTDVMLIDDDIENCRLAVTQGYHAAHCAKTGLSASWFAAQSDVQALLGVTADEIPRRRAV